MAVKRDRKRHAKKLATAVRSHTRRLRHSETAEPSIAPTPTSPVKVEPPNIPNDLVEERQAVELNNGPPVMLVITVLAVLFICLIAWFVAQMPAK
jgi:hypothetical protein